MIRRIDIEEDSDCCDYAALVLLSQDKLDSESVQRLASHLDRCCECRNKLNDLSSTGTDWEETRSVILEHNTGRNGRTTSQSNTPKNPSNNLSSLVRWLEPLSEKSDTVDQYLGQVDTYLIKRVLGYGGMGVVLEAWDTKLQRLVAIKAMHPHLAANGTARQRFVRETRGAAAVVHPNVVAIHTVHADHDPPYFVMPLISGESLQTRLDQTGPLDIESCLRIAIQIADGLTAAHAQGLVHRDIKPANILLEHGSERALLTDFGVVRVLDEATMTAGSVIAGTPEYMSPEQATGQSVDTRSDLFSLGCVLYAMLSGRSPFRSDTAWGVLQRIQRDHPRPLSQVRHDIPEALEYLISWLLEKDADRRVASTSNLADDLRQLLAHQVDREHNPLPQRLLPKRNRRNIDRMFNKRFALVTVLIILLTTGAWQARSFLMRQTRLESLTDRSSVRTPISNSFDNSSLPDYNLLDIEIQKLDQWTTELQRQLTPIAPQPSNKP